MNPNRDPIEKQFDALIARLPRQPKRRGRRVLAYALVALFAMAATWILIGLGAPATAIGDRVSFPLAVCGNGRLEPSEDCELNEPDCPPDCIRAPRLSSDSTTQQEGKRKE